ncbi:nuclear transport factor 2 family protein [Methylocapsa aurea]|uniref:nuclear transport factor 2 family protein n=1 Tax=Methylocapsa aurea TaxID=663610 RepID=UPI00055E33E7|nr:nuclear transport factor 2 family protein [Methylocapsa aurea]
MMQPLETVQMLYKALGAGDAPSALGLMDPDIEWIGMAGWPYQPGGRGPQRVAENVLTRLTRDWKDFSVYAEHYFADADTVIALGRYVGVHRQTGKALDARFAHVWDVANAQIVRFRQYADTHLVQRAMQ